MRTVKFALCLIAVMSATTFWQSGILQLVSAVQSQDKKTLPNSGLIDVGCSVIDPIDEVIQKRFSNVDGMFGLTRVMPTTQHVNYFLAETSEEKAVVDELENAGLQVGFYLAGRRILGQKPADNEISITGRHLVIGGPIAITRIEKMKFEELRKVFPDPARFWDDGQKAMRVFETKDRYEFSVDKWKVEARPIRARESCLKCHYQPTLSAADKINGIDLVKQAELSLSRAPRIAQSNTSIKIGDALGVAIYVYAKKQ